MKNAKELMLEYTEMCIRDSLQTEFAKPLGSNAHDPSVCLRLVTLRITHRSSPSLPESARTAPVRKIH